jgi:site-specific DNA-cytosine methylase
MGGENNGVVVNDNNIYNLFFTIFDLCCIIDTKEKDKYERSRELLQILWEEIGKKEIWQEIRRFISIQEKKILQSNLYENELYEDRKSQSKISTSTSNSSEYNESITNREKMFNMWKNWKTRYTPQRWELSEQQFRQFNLFMQELSYETTQRETSVQDMWQTNERFRILQQTLFKIQKIWRSNENKISNGLRIRKLTPREAFRLMGVKDEDFDKVKKNQSDSSLYHLAGDSIVVNVLMAIFKEMI